MKICKIDICHIKKALAFIIAIKQLSCIKVVT